MKFKICYITILFFFVLLILFKNVHFSLRGCKYIVLLPTVYVRSMHMKRIFPFIQGTMIVEERQKKRKETRSNCSHQQTRK